MQKKYSLCLGGGGARGLISLGVFRYLEEKNIKIHDISGTSMGAIVGAAIALGMSYKEMYAICSKQGRLTNLLSGIHFGKGLISDKKVMQILEKIFGDADFDDTKIPLKIIATNLKNGKKHIFSSGNIAFACRASSSLAAIFPPAIDDFGNYFIDGYYSDNLPVSETMLDQVLAVSTMHIDDTISSSSKKVLYKSIFISIYNSEQNSILLSGKKVDLLMPRISFPFYDFSQLDTAVEIGYNAARTFFEKNY